MNQWIKLMVFTLICVSINATNLYRWKDNTGQWHFSDQPPKGKRLIPEQRTEISAVKWKSTPKIKHLEPTHATKGKGFKTQNATLCEKLKKSMQNYEEKANENLWDYESREEKRRYRWEVQKHC